MTIEERLEQQFQEWKAAIAKQGMRSVKEWIGAKPDSMPTDRIKMRVRLVADDKCHITGSKIRNKACEMEHVISLADCARFCLNGNRESNLRPALVLAHREKTSKEASERAAANRIAQKHAGMGKSKHPIAQPPKKDPEPKATRSSPKLDSIRALGQGEIARRFIQK